MTRAVAAPMLAFSTLACPEWTPLEVVHRAADMGFEGIEWRGGPDGHAGPQLSPSARQAVRAAMDDHGLSAVSVTAYTDLVHSDRRVRAASVDQLVEEAEVAVGLGASCIRAFLGERPPNVSMDVALEQAADGLRDAAGRIEGSGVAMAIEPHDDFAASATIAGLLDSLGRPDIGAVWDAGNSWSIGEQPEYGLALLRPWLRYVQVKDGTGRLPDWRLCRLGAGDVPIGDALTWLVRSGMLVPVSIEWERPWHPELPPAADALPEGLAHLRSLLDAVTARTQEAT